METKEYNVLIRFRQHGKGWVEAGSTVEMTEVEARYLLLDGKLEVKKETSSKTSKTSKAKAEGLIMQGVCAVTGKALAGYAHLQQSIRDILTTPINSRVMRREYGSDVPDLIDAPMNDDTIIDVYAAVAVALDKWEPRFKLEQIYVTAAEPGKMELALVGEYLPDGETIRLERIVL